jgi:hypothetical protein
MKVIILGEWLGKKKVEDFESEEEIEEYFTEENCFYMWPTERQDIIKMEMARDLCIEEWKKLIAKRK